MTREEYKKAMQKIHEDYTLYKDQIRQRFAFERSTVRIGDIVRDHTSVIKIEKIEACMSPYTSFPECRYFGVRCSEENEVVSPEEKRYVYQKDIKEGKLLTSPQHVLNCK